MVADRDRHGGGEGRWRLGVPVEHQVRGEYGKKTHELVRPPSHGEKAERTTPDLTEAVSLYRCDNDELVQALRALSEVERDLGHNDEALKLYEEGVAVCREVGDPLLVAHTIGTGAAASRRGACRRRRAVLPRGAGTLSRPRECSSAGCRQRGTAAGDTQEDAGDTEAARRLWEEALDLYEACGVQAGVDECSERLTRLNRDRP